ncbi:MAG: hypothetical protein QM719_03455 [Thermomonas sp.]
MLLFPAFAHADVVAGGCTTAALVSPGNSLSLAPVASELIPAYTDLGATGAVLSQAYDASQSVDQVLLRLRLASCGNIANAMRPGAAGSVDPNDPAAYKPQTQWDNTPWRFNMTQNGKRMTADEFDAWMKARGVRVVGRKPDPAPAVAPTPPAEPAKDN